MRTVTLEEQQSMQVLKLGAITAMRRWWLPGWLKKGGGNGGQGKEKEKMERKIGRLGKESDG